MPNDQNEPISVNSTQCLMTAIHNRLSAPTHVHAYENYDCTQFYVRLLLLLLLLLLSLTSDNDMFIYTADCASSSIRMLMVTHSISPASLSAHATGSIGYLVMKRRQYKWKAKCQMHVMSIIMGYNTYVRHRRSTDQDAPCSD